MTTLYDFGYGAGFKLVELANFCESRNIMIADVRWSPSSRNPQYRKPFLEKTLGRNYIHLPKLGNTNFKGSLIVIDDLFGGCDQLLKLLERSHVAIMCVCWKFDTCHRKLIVDHMKSTYGIESAWLSKEMVAEVSLMSQPELTHPNQLDMFQIPPPVPNSDESE